MTAAAATVWVDSDGQFQILNHEYFEQAEEHAEWLGESGISVRVLYREDFTEKIE